MKTRSTPDVRRVLRRAALFSGAAVAAMARRRTADIEYARSRRPSHSSSISISSPAPAARHCSSGYTAGPGTRIQRTDAAHRARRARLRHCEPRLRPGVHGAVPRPGARDQGRGALSPVRGRPLRFDTTRIGILGASSGGHLAALVGVTNGHPELEGTLLATTTTRRRTCRRSCRISVHRTSRRS